MTGKGRPRRARRDGALVMVAAIVAPALAWGTQLWALALLGDIPCREGGSASLLGIDVGGWWIGVSVATMIIAAGSLLVVARRLGRVGRGGDEDTEGELARFLALVGVLSGGLFLGTIALGMTAPVFIDCA